MTTRTTPCSLPAQGSFRCVLPDPSSGKAGATKARHKEAMKGHVLSPSERIGLYRGR